MVLLAVTLHSNTQWPVTQPLPARNWFQNWRRKTNSGALSVTLFGLSFRTASIHDMSDKHPDHCRFPSKVTPAKTRHQTRTSSARTNASNRLTSSSCALIFIANNIMWDPCYWTILDLQCWFARYWREVTYGSQWKIHIIKPPHFSWYIASYG